MAATSINIRTSTSSATIRISVPSAMADTTVKCSTAAAAAAVVNGRRTTIAAAAISIAVAAEVAVDEAATAVVNHGSRIAAVVVAVTTTSIRGATHAVAAAVEVVVVPVIGTNLGRMQLQSYTYIYYIVPRYVEGRARPRQSSLQFVTPRPHRQQVCCRSRE